MGCFRIPLTYFSFSEAAIAQIEIEQQPFSLVVDTGANFCFALQKKCLNKIENKKSIEPSKGIDLKGNTYIEETYQVPLIKIERMKIEDVPVKEKSLQFILNRGLSSEITGRERNQIEYIHGNIGNRFFDNFVCFFDLNTPVLFLSRNLQNINKLHSLAGFTEITFESTPNGFVILEFETDFGLKRMFLDSGTSHSILKKSEIDQKFPIRFKDSLSYITSRTFNIKGSNLGAWDFYLYEFTDKFSERFDGVLGIDFFKDHMICIDYQNNKAYIKAYNKPFKKFWTTICRILIDCFFS